MVEDSALYKVHNTYIECPSRGSEFIFAGIGNDPNKIKSMEGVTRCWVCEAAKVSEESWQILKNTIRREGSEIWIDFNPDLETDPTAKRFLLNPPPDSVLIELNWQDNPWLPETLRKEKDYDYRVDPEAAANIWGGQFRKASAAQVLRGKYIVQEFTPQEAWTGPYFGADWGFANDPTTLLKLWMCERVFAAGMDDDLLERAQPGDAFLSCPPGSHACGCRKPNRTTAGSDSAPLRSRRLPAQYKAWLCLSMMMGSTSPVSASVL
jgi:hypothetical protein